MKVQAQDIYDKYFKAAQAQPRGVVAKLGNIVAQIERACQKQHMSGRENGSAWREMLVAALDELSLLLQEDGVVSAYELHSSGLVQALLALLSTSCWDEGLNQSKSEKLLRQRERVFRSCFKVSSVLPILSIFPWSILSSFTIPCTYFLGQKGRKRKQFRCDYGSEVDICFRVN